MDYRHTEDFARCMDVAELRAQSLRNEAITAFFAAIGRALRRLVHRVASSRDEQLLPEA
ncbi:hypothetical protein JJB11_24785 [Ramlibacter ginsenosidimutans]|uniref:Uncharacterized protein n=1 Tax=Ramlibacter ginsenosidimutans TaxID=502333 RepID=A0A934TXJ3_9BURK|nr:hypothetical protein [Ramlibacter ginsenosidimutans]MBK6009328.1 hypothetical protein [Ramlibacter ginsenosidimutans]